MAVKKSPVKRTKRVAKPKAPATKRPEPITEQMTLGALAESMGVRTDEVVAFLRTHMKPCAWNHTTLAVFVTSYFCAQDQLSFPASTCDAHADYAPCPKCGGKARRCGIRAVSC